MGGAVEIYTFSNVGYLASFLPVLVGYYLLRKHRPNVRRPFKLPEWMKYVALALAAVLRGHLLLRRADLRLLHVLRRRTHDARLLLHRHRRCSCSYLPLYWYRKHVEDKKTAPAAPLGSPEPRRARAAQRGAGLGPAPRRLPVPRRQLKRDRAPRPSGGVLLASEGRPISTERRRTKAAELARRGGRARPRLRDRAHLRRRVRPPVAVAAAERTGVAGAAGQRRRGDQASSSSVASRPTATSSGRERRRSGSSARRSGSAARRS